MSSSPHRSTRHSGAELSDLVLPPPIVRTPGGKASTPMPDAVSSKKKKRKNVERKKGNVEKKKREVTNVFTEAKYAEDDAKWVADHGRSVAAWVMRSRKAAPPLMSAIMEKKVQQRRADGSLGAAEARRPSGSATATRWPLPFARGFGLAKSRGSPSLRESLAARGALVCARLRRTPAPARGSLSAHPNEPNSRSVLPAPASTARGGEGHKPAGALFSHTLKNHVT